MKTLCPALLFFCVLAPLATAAKGQPSPRIAELTPQVKTGPLADRVEAVMALLAMGRDAESAGPMLVTTLCDDAELDNAVAGRILYFKPRPAEGVPALIEGLKHDTKARVTAAWTLSEMGPAAGEDAARALIAALQHPDKHERNLVVLAIAMCGAPAGEAIAPLRAVMNDKGSDAAQQTNYKYPRAMAAIAIGMLGPAARDAVPDLIQLLEEPGAWEYQRAAACFALGRIGPAAGEAAPALQRAGQDPSAVVRAHATRAIAGVTASRPKGGDVTALLERLAVAGKPLDARTFEGLDTLGRQAGAIRAVAKKDKRAPPVHESVTLAIAFLGQESNAPSPADIAQQEATRRFDERVRLHIMALGGVQQGIVQALLASLDREEPPPAAAARQLGASGTRAATALPALRTLLDDPDWWVRREASLAIDQLASPAAQAK